MRAARAIFHAGSGSLYYDALFSHDATKALHFMAPHARSVTKQKAARFHQNALFLPFIISAFSFIFPKAAPSALLYHAIGAIDEIIPLPHGLKFQMFKQCHYHQCSCTPTAMMMMPLTGGRYHDDMQGEIFIYDLLS